MADLHYSIIAYPPVDLWNNPRPTAILRYAEAEDCMFDHLKIRNFKSVEHIDLNCRRVNVLIGEPNTGKSNILEALGLISYVGYSEYSAELQDFARYDDISNLFYEGDLSRTIEITLGKEEPFFNEHQVQRWDHLQFQLQFSEGRFNGDIDVWILTGDPSSDETDSYVQHNYSITGDYQSLRTHQSGYTQKSVDYCKFYRFSPRATFPEKASASLLPPSGANLLSLLIQDRELRAEVSEPFLSRGLRLGLRPQENKIEVLKDFEDVIISHPYHLASDTFQRLVFYMAALRTNSDSVLVFEEPEAHAFPYYTKYLAERIALDDHNNQYFVSTHNPYFLLPILEKTLSGDIAVFITYYEDYRTKVMQLPPEDLERISDNIDVFSNIDMFLEDR